MKHLSVVLIIGFCSNISFSQSIWSESNADTTDLNSIEHEQLPTSFRLLELNINSLESSLTADNLTQQCIDIPMPDGSNECFLLEETYIIPKKLGAVRQDIKTFKGTSIANPKQVLYFSQSNNNFHLIGDSEEGTFFIDKVEKDKQAFYMSYYAKDEVRPEFACQADDVITPEEFRTASPRNSQAVTSWGTELRKYKMALLWTPSHVANYNNDTSAIIDRNVEVVTDMNFVCERDLCITFELAPNPQNLIFPDANTSPYDGLGSITGIMNDTIGAENFDIGYGMVGGGGGVSYLGITCGSGRANSQGSNSHWVIVHELGHNMGAGHTFNHCPDWGANGIEPGAGNSIMSYGGSGVCSTGHQVPNGRINYFHSRSVEQMYNKLFINSNCGTVTSTGNTPPTITLPTGGFTIPKLTPFTLTGSATDAEDASNLTYSWEQYNSGVGSNPATPTATDPIFQMFPFSDAPARTIPKIESIINGYTLGEILPDVSRNLDFRLSVRDNHTGGSGVAFDNMSFSVTADAGPFEITYPNQYEAWTIGQSYNVTWDVANTNQAPVSCALVDILLSVDGGFTYPHTLATNVANDGEQSVTVPDAVGTQNRIKVAAADNIFFDISNEDFEIFAADAYDYSAKLNTNKQSVCSETTTTFQLTTTAIGTFSTTIDLSLSGLPTNATLNMPAMVNATSVNTINIENLVAVAAGVYPMTLTLTETGGSINKSFTLNLVKKENGSTTTPDQAVNFDGTGQIHIPKNNTDFDFGDKESFSIELWTKTTTTSGDDAIISDKNWNSGKNKGWVIAIQNGQLAFNVADGTNRIDIGSNGATYNDDKWHHIAVSFSRTDQGYVKFYVDGVLKSETIPSALGDISLASDIVIGADKDNQYRYEGQIEEVRIWKKALSVTEIRENMHRILNNCDANLISMYQFNEANGNALDAFSHHHGTPTNVTRVVSSAPFGIGTANTQTETTGSLSFTNTAVEINYSTQASQMVTATKINLTPFGGNGIESGDVVLDNQYWVLNRYENSGELNFNATFTLAEDIPIADESQPFIYKIYGRNFNEDGDWTLLTYAASLDATNERVTFHNLNAYGQFLIAKHTQPTLALYSSQLSFCPVELNGESEVRSYEIGGAFLNAPLVITAPTDLLISTQNNTGFSNSLNLTPTSGTIPSTTIYVKFIPSTATDFTGTITHNSTGATERTINITGKSVIVKPYNAMTFDGTGNVHIPKTNADFNFGNDKDFSIDFWTKTSTTSGDDALVSNKDWDSGRYTGWVIAIQSGGMVFNAGDGSNRVDIGTGAEDFNDNEWHHVAVSFSRTNTLVQLYIDGKKKSETSLASLGSITNTLDVTMGADALNNYDYEGILEEVRIWNKALSETEIRGSMHLVFTGCPANIIANYHMDETSGNALDALGNHHGTVTNATRIASSAPIGSGTANSQTEVNGIVTFSTTNFSANYNSHTNAAITTTLLNGSPYGAVGINPTDSPLDSQYWVVNHFINTGSLNFGATFTLLEDILPAQASMSNDFKLYGRAFNADATWTFLGTASAANAANNSLTFSSIGQYGQYLVTRDEDAVTCEDGMQNGDETGVDCGGACAPCAGNCLATYTKNDMPISGIETIAAADSIMSVAQINGTANITYQAGKAIILKPGFQVSAGADFLATIANCTPSPISETSIESTAKLANTTTDRLADSDFLIFPNPANQKLQIQVNSAFNQGGQLLIFNTLGSLVYQKEMQLTEGFNQFGIDVATYPEGMFWAKCYFEKEGAIKLLPFVKSGY